MGTLWAGARCKAPVGGGSAVVACGIAQARRVIWTTREAIPPGVA